MKTFEINDVIITSNEYRGNTDIVELALVDTFLISSLGKFERCKNLTNVYFGLDITRIGNRTFADCENLTDVWFAITDKNKFIEIAEDAFRGCPKQITFHIFASAKENKYLNDYAKRHGFKVVGMI